MSRILISQNETNNSTEYLIVNGHLLDDDDNMLKYGRIISKTDDWGELYKDDFLEIRKNENQLLIKSFYTDKDIVNRSIYYIYLIDETEDFDVILNQLEKDSQLIHRTIDREKTQNLINRIKNDEEIKKKIIKYLIITVGVSFGIYLLSKI